MTTTLLIVNAVIFTAILVLSLCRSRGSADRDDLFMRELQDVRERLKKHDAAAAGFWRTAKGEVLRIRDMSTGHLRNCINGGFANGTIALDMAREIARRTEDAGWRALDPEAPTVAESSRADDVVALDERPDENRRAAADLRALAQNDYMIDTNMLPDGVRLCEIARMLEAE